MTSRVDMDAIIDVKHLMQKYTIDELNQSADDYYKNFEARRINLKPFDLPGAQHLFAEFAHMASGLELGPGDKVLDFGCGTGWSSRMLNACGCEVIGMDVSSRAVDIATRISMEWRKFFDAMGSPSPPLSFKRFDGYCIDLPDSSMDKIFIIDAFHHIPNQADLLREFHRVLVPGGIVGFCEPGPNHSRSPEAQLEMKLYKVIENDINVYDIWSTAKNIGFADIQIFISPLIGRRLSIDRYSKFPSNSSEAKEFLKATDWRSKNFPIFFLHKKGDPSGDSRRSEGLKSRIRMRSAPASVQEGIPFKVEVEISNIGASRWLPSGFNRGSVNVGFIITDQENSSEYRHGLSSDPVMPGSVLPLTLDLPPLPAGRYLIEIDVVAEFVCWFRHAGSESVRFHLDVLAR